MKLLSSLTAAAVLCIGASGASALSFNGGNVEFGYTFNTDDTTNDTLVLDGSFAINFGGSFGAQIDLGYNAYQNGGNSPHYIYGAHLTYALNPALTLGAFYTHEDWDGYVYSYMGAEAIYSFGNNSIEAFVGYSEDTNSSAYDGMIYGAHGSFGLTQKIDALVGVNYFAVSKSEMFAYVGAAYEFNDQLSASIRLGGLGYQGEFDETVILVGVTYSFGAPNATLFSGRHYADLIPGY